MYLDMTLNNEIKGTSKGKMTRDEPNLSEKQDKDIDKISMYRAYPRAKKKNISEK